MFNRRKPRRPREHPKTSKLGKRFLVNEGITYDDANPDPNDFKSHMLDDATHQLTETEQERPPKIEDLKRQIQEIKKKEDYHGGKANKSYDRFAKPVIYGGVGTAAATVGAFALGLFPLVVPLLAASIIPSAIWGAQGFYHSEIYARQREQRLTLERQLRDLRGNDFKSMVEDLDINQNPDQSAP